jgi:peptide/nickel transport system substrate-binding protein
MRNLIKIITTVLLVVSLMSACSTSKSPNNNSSSKKPTYGGTIVIGTSTEPDSLDPHKTGEAAADNIMENEGASLVFQDPKTKKFHPYLAKSWNISADGKVWTFKLRNDVKFQDGTPFTAESYVKTFQRAQKTNLVAGGNLTSLSQISAPDKYTLVLKLKQSYAPLLQYLSDPGWMQPLPIKTGKENFSRKPIGVGPWVFSSWKNGQSITFKANKDYKWGTNVFSNKKRPYPNKLQYKFISDTQTLLAALDSGSVDAVTNVPANQVGKYIHNQNFYVLQRPRNGLGMFIDFNVKNQFLKDENIRKAINYAIDKKAILKAILHNYGEISYGPLPSSYVGYDKNVEKYGYHLSLKKANQLLQQSGYKKGKNGIYQKNGKELQLTLMTQTNVSDWKNTAVMIQSMLKKVGIQVKVDAREWGSLVADATKHNFDMTIMGYSYSDPDVLSLFLKSSQSKGGLNLGSVIDPKLDKMLDSGRSTLDTQERKKVYAEIQKYVVKKAYWAPMVNETQFFVVSKKVSGLQLQPFQSLLFQDGWVNK